MPFQLFCAEERLKVSALRTSVLRLISSIMLYGRKDIQYVKSAWSVLHAELKARVPPLLKGNTKSLLKVNNKNTRTRCAMCSKLTIKTAELYSKSKIEKIKLHPTSLGLGLVLLGCITCNPNAPISLSPCKVSGSISSFASLLKGLFCS